MKTISARYNYIITKRAKIAGVLVSPSAICNLIEIRERSTHSNLARMKHIEPSVQNALQKRANQKKILCLTFIHPQYK